MASEEVKELFVAALNFGYFVRVAGDDFVDESINGSSVGGLKPHFLGQSSRIFFRGIPESGKELLCLAVGDGACLDEV